MTGMCCGPKFAIKKREASVPWRDRRGKGRRRCVEDGIGRGRFGLFVKQRTVSEVSFRNVRYDAPKPVTVPELAYMESLGKGG